MKVVLGVIRLFGMVVIVVAYLIPILLGVILFKKDRMWTVKRRQSVARALVRWLNIKIEMSGKPQNGNFLFIGNHRSYADPAIAACYVAFMPVAKAEVASWAIIGFAAKATGVIYVKREDKMSRNYTRLAVRQAFQAGFPVLIYPEGTTTDAAQTRPFRVGTFQIAVEEKISVIPITIEYGQKSDVWIGKDTFIPHFIRCFGKWETKAFIHFGEPIHESDADVLAKHVQNSIDNKLAQWAKINYMSY